MADGGRTAQSDIKYIICNGDEGDPGAFMDRMLLESYPYRIIEGMVAAGYAMGAKEGILIYPGRISPGGKPHLQALEICREQGYLGKEYSGNGFDFDLTVYQGAGAFVCGEETALMESIEGKRGFPRIRPPYPAVKGLWGAPTLINNTETFAQISYIMKNGAAAFNRIGTESSRGTKGICAGRKGGPGRTH